MLPPKRFKQNTTKATEIKRNGTEAIGIDQDGIAKSIDIEVLMTKDNVGLGDVDNTSDADKPVSTAQQAELDLKIPLAQKGQASGVATLGADGLVPSAQLPSYVDDVLEYDSLSLLPETGEASKIYVTLDTNLTYRWSGSGYTEISKSLALGETEATAYRGDRGKTAYDHTLLADNPHSVTKEQVGLGNADNTSDADKPVSNAQQAELDLKIPLAQKAAVNGIATLGSDGKIPSAQIPSIALVDVFPVSSEAAMLALVAQQGDMAIRSDTSQVFILSASPATTIENWIELSALKALVDASIVDLAGAGRTTETVKGNADALTTLNGDDTTAGSVLKSIKEQAQKGDFAPTVASGIESETLEEAVNEVGVDVEAVKGTDWADETVKGNAKDIDTLNADATTAGSVAKTVKDAVEPVKGTGWTDENLVDHEVRLQILEYMPHVSSWADVQSLVRAGNASAYFHVGTQFNALWNGVERTLEVIGIDHDTPTDTAYTHSLTLQFKDILRTGRISGPEAMYNAVTELPAGTYIFTTNGVQYTFTSTQDVPADGVIYIKTRNEYAPLTLTIYDANRISIIEDNIAVTTTTGTDNLTPINDYVRMRYGSNLYEISAIRQWLNSEDATFVWQPLGLYDMPSSYATAGFINLLDADLQAVIGAVDKQVARANYDGGGQDTFSDKVFLLSRKEIFGDDEGVVTDEVVYPFWDGSSNADRIKGSPSYWWLRSPYVGVTYLTRVVSTSGTLSNYNANYAYGLSPACVIW